MQVLVNYQIAVQMIKPFVDISVIFFILAGWLGFKSMNWGLAKLYKEMR